MAVLALAACSDGGGETAPSPAPSATGAASTVPVLSAIASTTTAPVAEAVGTTTSTSVTGLPVPSTTCPG